MLAQQYFTVLSFQRHNEDASARNQVFCFCSMPANDVMAMEVIVKVKLFVHVAFHLAKQYLSNTPTDWKLVEGQYKGEQLY